MRRAARRAPAAEPPSESTAPEPVPGDEVDDDAAEESGPPAGPVTNAVTGLVVIALAAAVVLGSWSLGVGTARSPGAGTWPLLVGCCTGVLGIALVVLARRSHDAGRFTRQSLGVLAGIATMVVFVVLVPRTGFEVPAALLCFVWLRFLGREGWRTSVLVSLGAVAVFYLVFVVALAVPIPHLF